MVLEDCIFENRRRERILKLVEEEESISQVRLTTYLAIRYKYLSGLLVKLEKGGDIFCKNEQDKRETMVSLPELGESRSKEVQSVKVGQLSVFLYLLAQEEREQLFTLIEKTDSYGR